MKNFVIDFTGGDSYLIQAETPREAARKCRKMGKDLMKYNNTSSSYWVWDEKEETLFYHVLVFKTDKRTIAVINNCLKEK